MKIYNYISNTIFAPKIEENLSLVDFHRHLLLTGLFNFKKNESNSIL